MESLNVWGARNILKTSKSKKMMYTEFAQIQIKTEFFCKLVFKFPTGMYTHYSESSCTLLIPMHVNMGHR